MAVDATFSRLGTGSAADLSAIPQPVTEDPLGGGPAETRQNAEAFVQPTTHGPLVEAFELEPELRRMS